MFDFFRINRTVGPAHDLAPDDAIAAKTALAELGHYEIPRTGITPYADGALFAGIKNFQREQGLKVDGLMKPDGPTAGRLDARLAEAKAAPATPAANKSAARGTPPQFGVRPAVTAEQAATNARTLDGLLKSADDGALPQLFARALTEGGDSARAEYDDFLGQLKAKAPDRLSRFQQTVADAMPDTLTRQAQGPGAEKLPAPRHIDDTSTTHHAAEEGEDAPVINEEKARIQNIIDDKPARIEIRRNPQAGRSWGFIQTQDLASGSAAVKRHDPIIREMAKKHDVDPDLVRAVMWAENAWGVANGLGKIC